MQAQLSLTSIASSPYTQNFNTYRGNSLTLPTGFTVGTTGMAAVGYRGAGTGTGSGGGFWAFVPTGNTTDYSFGVLRSGAAGEFTLNSSFTNSTGAKLTSLTLTFNYEQYRYANASGLALTGTGDLASTNLSAHNFTGSANGTDGTPTSTAETITLTGLSIANGDSFGFTFTTVDDAGNADNGLAIDDFSLSYSAGTAPEPATCLAGTLMVGAAGWSQRRRVCTSFSRAARRIQSKLAA